ncbi:MAG TPA: hypothetical protein VLK65_03165 [Vicinamibacteria bacterium]|nr:hypothetical protein [Vicinamibacteria bacterium]
MEELTALSPAERFRIAMDLFQTGVDLMRQNLKRQHPHATEDQIEELLRAWLRHRPGAEFGDSEGRPGAWPRKRR